MSYTTCGQLHQWSILHQRPITIASLRTVSLVQVAVRGAGELVRGVLRGGEEAAGRHVHGLLRGARHQGVAGAELGSRGVIAVAVDGDTVPAEQISTF